MAEVLLRGGPYDGQTVPVSDTRSPVILEGDGVPDGMVARYGPTRERGVYHFREYDRIAVRVPMPGGSDG